MGKLDETDQIKKLSDELSKLRDTYAGELRQRAWLVSERDRAQAQQANAQRQLDTHMAQVEAAECRVPEHGFEQADIVRAQWQQRAVAAEEVCDRWGTRVRELEGERDAAENRARCATQSIVEHIGAAGPESLEEALARLLARVKACDALAADVASADNASALLRARAEAAEARAEMWRERTIAEALDEPSAVGNAAAVSKAHDAAQAAAIQWEARARAAESAEFSNADQLYEAAAWQERALAAEAAVTPSEAARDRDVWRGRARNAVAERDALTKEKDALVKYIKALAVVEESRANPSAIDAAAAVYECDGPWGEWLPTSDSASARIAGCLNSMTRERDAWKERAEKAEATAPAARAAWAEAELEAQLRLCAAQCARAEKAEAERDKLVEEKDALVEYLKARTLERDEQRAYAEKAEADVERAVDDHRGALNDLSALRRRTKDAATIEADSHEVRKRAAAWEARALAAEALAAATRTERDNAAVRERSTLTEWYRMRDERNADSELYDALLARVGPTGAVESAETVGQAPKLLSERNIAFWRTRAKKAEAEIDAAQWPHIVLTGERDTLIRERDALTEERDAMMAERDSMTAERDARDVMTAEWGAAGLAEMTADRDEWRTRAEKAEAEHDALAARTTAATAVLTAAVAARIKAATAALAAALGTP